MEQKTGFKEMVLRLVAIVGLVAVLILGAWGIILLAFNVAGLLGGSVHFSDFFTSKNTPSEVVTTDTNTASTTTIITTTNSQPATTVTKPTTTTSQPSATYTAAPRAASLYGLPDLAVTITSVTSLSSVQGRTVVSFIVSNVGTNVAYSGWTFNAQLPLTPAYTYQSQGQQALYPGDKIAYTLTYDNPNYQYNYNGQYQYNNQYPYNTQPQTCYTYNGYQNVAGACPITYDQNGNAIYGNNQYNNQYPYNQNTNYYGTGYNQNYNYNTQYPYGGAVTVTVDPQNRVPETSEYNNSASKSSY